MADSKMDVGSCSPKIVVKSIECECSQSVLTRADGSASFKQGATEVLAAIYGPVEVKISKEMIDRATVECNYRTKTGLPGTAEKLVERLIRNSCDAIILSSYNPRSAISIIVQVLNDSGELLSCSLNAAFMALVNADIPLKCMAAAVSCMLSKDGEISLNGKWDYEEEPAASFTFVFESTKRDLITSFSKGTFTIEQYFSCLAASREAVKSVLMFQRKSFERTMSKEKRS